MPILGGVAKEAGLAAVQEAHRALDGAIPDAQKAADEIVSRFASEVVTQATGALTEAAGAICTALGSLPEFVVDALDGLTIEISPITVRVARRKP